MKKVSTVEARENFSDIINTAAYGKERIILTRRGKGLVAVVPIEDIALLERLEDEIDVQESLKAIAEAKEQGTVSLEAIEKRLGI